MTDCPHGDPHCPCQDGDACHYEDVGDSKAWVPPDCPVCHDNKIVPVGEWDPRDPLVEAEDLVRCPACTTE